MVTRKRDLLEKRFLTREEFEELIVLNYRSHSYMLRPMGTSHTYKGHNWYLATPIDRKVDNMYNIYVKGEESNE